MKYVILASILMFCQTSKLSLKELKKKIENRESIKKDDFSCFSPNSDLTNFEDEFVPTGKIMNKNNLFLTSFDGIKGDTLFNLLLVFRNDTLIHDFLLPKYTLAKQESSGEQILHKSTKKGYYKEFAIGDISVNYSKDDKYCLDVILKEFVPVKMDTINGKFISSMGRIKSSETISICNTIPRK